MACHLTQSVVKLHHQTPPKIESSDANMELLLNSLACTDPPWWAAQHLQHSSCLHQTTHFAGKRTHEIHGKSRKALIPRLKRPRAINHLCHLCHMLIHFVSFCHYLYTLYSEINSNVKDKQGLKSYAKTSAPGMPPIPADGLAGCQALGFLSHI